ncbi:MAG: hypothetical protein VX461_00810, partial [Candidatus Thermoplasmatota archaeon]|nr:hypothetical protein [Candidatus Thermoplasmatota archaeon]MEC7425441.1 hypothetical protein [Candidatus Thermoplasmatota archaeon]
LVEFGPTERMRISTACCLGWPLLLAIAAVNRDEGNASAVLTLILVSVILYSISWSMLRSDVKTRRWRGLVTTIGFTLAIPIVLESDPASLLIMAIAASFTTLPILFTKDGLEEERQDFSEQLKDAEKHILDLQSGNTMMQQPNSLLKKARETGWKNPERGIELISEAKREANRISLFVSDVEEIRQQSEISVNRAEKVTGFPGRPRKIFEDALRELENGSLRASESRFREAKSEAEAIESNWQNALEAIDKAENAISDAEGHLVQGLRSTLNEAKKAMEDEDPQYALAIVSEIPSQMDDVEDLMLQARKSLEEAKSEVSHCDSAFIVDLNKRLEDAKEALDSGNASLSIGLSEGVTRSIRKESEAKTTVQRSLRQVKSIEDRIPAGELGFDWTRRMAETKSSADAGKWIDAAESLRAIVGELDDFHSRVEEAREMLEFLDGDWRKLRKRLESSGYGAENKDRISTERHLVDAERALSEGEIDDCLESLGDADSSMEALRRLV